MGGTTQRRHRKLPSLFSRRRSTGSLAGLNGGRASRLFCDYPETKAMPDVGGAARNQLLLHQFLAGLPVQICKQLRAAGDVTSMETALE